MKGMAQYFIALWAVLLAAGLASAQPITIQASVSKNTVGPEEQFSYSVEVSGSTTSLPDVNFPDLSKFYVLSGPNESTNLQWINGKMSSSKILTFYLQPRQAGTFTIAPATVEYKGKTYRSNAITIKVTKTAQAPTAGRQKKQQRGRSDQELLGKSLYLKTEVSRRSAYLGEQITVSYKLYFRAEVRTYNVDKMPGHTGFWVEKFEMPSQPVIESTIINGIRYNVATLDKVALFPTQTGTLTVDPMRITVEAVVRARRSSRSLFDSFFDNPFGRTVRKALVSNPVKINVKPLPEEGKPADFSGAVGNFTLSVTADKTVAQVNDAISIKIKIRGTGNIQLVDIPKLNIPPDLEQYEPKVSTRVNNKGALIGGIKKAEYILIPRHEGEYRIKPVRFTFFNPKTKTYRTLTSNPLQLKILKGKETGLAMNPTGAGLSRQEVTLLGQDIRFIKEYSVFEPLGYRPYLSLSFWFTIVGALFLFLAFVVVNERQARIYGDQQVARRHKAGKIAAKQLSKAKSLIAAQDQSAFYKAVSQALQGFVLDKLNMELTEFSSENIRRVFSRRDIPEDEINAYLEVLQESDMGQFANVRADASTRQAVYEKAKKILTRLEKWI